MNEIAFGGNNITATFYWAISRKNIINKIRDGIHFSGITRRETFIRIAGRVDFEVRCFSSGTHRHLTAFPNKSICYFDYRITKLTREVRKWICSLRSYYDESKYEKLLFYASPGEKMTFQLNKTFY